MRQSGGNANPELVGNLVRERLGQRGRQQHKRSAGDPRRVAGRFCLVPCTYQIRCTP
jgi:hypothetical protein